MDDTIVVSERILADLIWKGSIVYLTETECEIKNIVFDEFSKVIKKIEADFGDNYIRKRNNFLLNEFDNNITANMVFVSSFESKSGFAIEACAKRIAYLHYGIENVPKVINPHGVDYDSKHINGEGQFLVTDINLEDGDLTGDITKFRANRVAHGSGKNRIESSVTQSSIKELLPIGQKYRCEGEVYVKPVDLAFFDGQYWNIFEIKAGGDLDSSNAPANVEKLLSIYTGLNKENTRVYFATLYNKEGEGNLWKGAVKKHLSYPEMFLIGSQFWNKILPDGVDFNRFCDLYKYALSELNFNEHIQRMLEDTVR